MKSLVRRSGDGFFSLILALCFIVLGLINTITGISYSHNTSTILIMCLPFLAVGSIFKIIPPKIYISLVMYMAAIYSGFNITEPGNYSSSIFLLLTYYTTKNKKVLVLVLITTVLIIAYQSTINEYRANVTISLILAYAVVYFSHYFIFNTKKSKNNPSVLTKDDYDKLSLYSKGYTTQQICDKLKLNIKSDSLKSYFTKLRNNFGCSNDFQFGILLADMREINNAECK